MKEFKNPISAFDTIPKLLEAILNVITIIAVPIIVLFLILAGFQYVTARGNPEGIKSANRSLLYGIIGGVIIAGATAIRVIIQSVVGEF